MVKRVDVGMTGRRAIATGSPCLASTIVPPRRRSENFGSRAETSKPARHRSVLLRVVTYNIHRAIGVDRRFRPQRIVRILHHLNPDVVLLQEVDDGAPRSRELD